MKLLGSDKKYYFIIIIYFNFKWIFTQWQWYYNKHNTQIAHITRNTTPTALYPPGRFLVLISVRCSVDPRAIVRLKGLGQLKNSTSSGLEPATFRVVA
jgi:hypothetical protein